MEIFKDPQTDPSCDSVGGRGEPMDESRSWGELAQGLGKLRRLELNSVTSIDSWCWRALYPLQSVLVHIPLIDFCTVRAVWLASFSGCELRFRDLKLLHLFHVQKSESQKDDLIGSLTRCKTEVVVIQPLLAYFQGQQARYIIGASFHLWAALVVQSSV